MSAERSVSPTPSLAISDAVMIDENDSAPRSAVPRDGLNAVLSATAHEFNNIVQTLAGLGYAIGPNSSECSLSPTKLSYHTGSI
jgi:hypothetical protein